MRIHGPSRRIFVPLALLLGLFAAAPLAGQGDPASLIVTVRVEGGQLLSGAQVVLEGMGLGGITDASGVARLRNLPPGGKMVVVRHLGYAPVRAHVTLEGGRPSTVAFVLVPQPIELAEVTVRGWDSTLYRNGFFERRATGNGTFLTRQDITVLRPRYLSDVMRRLPGVRVQSTSFGAHSRASMRGQVAASCPIQYYIDGAMSGMSNLDEIRPEDVEGVEIYRGASSIPPAFNKGTALCGVVLIWTRVQ